MRYEVKIGTLCNNNCVFCLNDQRGVKVPLQEIQAQIERARDLGVDSIDLTGGEAAIRNDFFRIVSLVKANNMGLCVHTNGRAFSYDDFCRRISGFGRHSFLVSLHAHNEDLNRSITQVAGGFQQTVQGIRNLVSYGHLVFVNVVVNRLNAGFLPEIAEHHSLLGVRSVQISWVRPQGKAAKDMTGLVPKYSDYLESLETAISILKKRGVKVFTISVPPCVLRLNRDTVCDPYENSVVIRDGAKFRATDVFNDIHRMKLDSCKSCLFNSSCDGFFRLYAEEYGTSEFRPVIVSE